MNEVVLAAVALGVLAPAAVTHVLRPRHLADTIAAHGTLPLVGPRRNQWPMRYAASLAVVESGVSVLLLVAMSQQQFLVAGLALAAVGAGFVAYLVALRHRRFAGDCGCSAFASATTVWSMLPGAALALAGVILAAGALPDDVAFATPAATSESVAAVVVAGALGFLVWMFPASVYRPEPSR